MELAGAFVLVTGMIIGVVELVKRLFDRDFRAACVIAAAAATGALCGVFHIEGIDVATGIVLGFTAAGAVKVAGTINTATTSRPPTNK